MKLLSYSHNKKESWGAVAGDGVIDMVKALGGKYATLADFIGSDDYERRDELIKGKSADVPLAAIKYLPVIPKAEKIICLVRNYLDHHKEVVAAGLQRELSEFPPIFLRVWRAQVGHLEPLVRPHVSNSFDWEGELAVIIGKGGRHIPKEKAMDHIAGYSIYNDGSIREWQFHAKQIAAGKNFVGTGPFGPWMVTKEEIPNPANLKLETRLNGKVMQSSNTANLIFDIPTIISYSSDIFDLVPGDVLVTGTPGGVGWSRKPPIFMQPGDVCEVEFEGIGVLRNPVVQED